MKINTKLKYSDTNITKIKVEVYDSGNIVATSRCVAKQYDTTLNDEFQGKEVGIAENYPDLTTQIALEGMKTLILNPNEVQVLLGLLMAVVVDEGWKVSYKVKED